MINLQQRFLIIISMFISIVGSTFAQTTAFTYQGKLAVSGSPATGNYDFEFRLFDLPSGGAQQGTTQTLTNVAVNAGIFTVQLDFGACLTCFNGGQRFLDMTVRATGGGAFTQLSPRQAVTSNPYALKSLNATAADGLSVACLNCVTSSQIASVNGSAVSGTIPVASVPAGSSNYIQNTTNPQTSSNFNISGNGTAGGTLYGNAVNATTEFQISGARALAMNTANGNLFGGFTGNTLPTGSHNTFFGVSTGTPNAASNNSFFGWLAGNANTSGSLNTFIGTQAGQLNTTAGENTFVGYAAGSLNQTGCCNSFFGRSSGQSNTIGSLNTFLGDGAGFANTTGSNNTFVGGTAGDINVGGSSNTIIGSGANVTSPNLSFAAAIGAGAMVNRSNAIILGRTGGQDDVVMYGHLFAINDATANNLVSNNITTANLSTDALTVNGVLNAAILNAASQFNMGGNRILSNPGTDNLFAGVNAGTGNLIGGQNAFFGSNAGNHNDDFNNSFFGFKAGFMTHFGSSNSFFGSVAGRDNVDGGSNSFFGSGAGATNNSGSSNSFFGFAAGSGNITGNDNTAFGDNAGFGFNMGNNNSYFGAFTTSLPGINNATAIGSRAVVTQSDSLVLGSIAGLNGATTTTRVGIGTTAPVSLFHLRDNSGSFAITLTNNANSVGSRGYRLSFDNDRFTFQRADDGGAFAENQIAIKQLTGNLGIGTIDPQDKLEVNGVIRFSGLGSAGGIQLCRNISNQISNCSSSIRYKTRVATYDTGLKLINRLRPVSFDWKQGGARDLGLIAEEVAKVEPLLVTHNDKGEIEGVKYDRVAVLLLNAVKEQQQQIDSQRTEIQEQKKLIESLRVLVCKANPKERACK